MGPKSAKYRIPEEVVELYGWRNGQAGDVPFFANERFQPFEDAVEYANLVEEYFCGTFPLMVFQELGYDAGYQFRCGPNEQKTAPAYEWQHGDEQIETPSLAELLGAIAEAFEAGVFRLDDRGEFDTDKEAWNSVLVRHHPERIRAMNLLLQRQWSGLRGEQLRNAFYDLWRMNHPDIANLIHEYLDANRAHLVEDFEAFHAAQSTGIGIQDKWTRDFMLDLAFSHDPRVRAAALTSLAWSWHGELSLTARQVDGFIDHIMTGPASDHCNRERAMLLGTSRDRRAIPALLQLINEDSSRDTTIAALRALGSLKAVEASQTCLAIAESDSDRGVRFTAVRTLLDLGLEGEPIEATAKAYFREMILRFPNFSMKDETPILKRWLEEVKQSILG